MSGNKHNGQEDGDVQDRIEELKRRAEELASGEVEFWESEDLPPEVAEQFLSQVVDFESAEWTTHIERLEHAGVELPDPETLSEEQIADKLWEVIRSLARERVFLSGTNHLSDRELYAHLWSDSLREEVPDMPFDENSAWHIDLVGSGSDDDTFLYLKHYADEEERQHWMTTFPDYEMPAHEEPPYDRDRLLPQANYEARPDNGQGEEG